jgi:hypothetical protein
VEERDKTNTEQSQDGEKFSREAAEKQAARLGEKVKEYDKTAQAETSKLMHGARRRTMQESGGRQAVEEPFRRVGNGGLMVAAN